MGGIVVCRPALELEGDLGLGRLPRLEYEPDVELEHTFSVAVFFSVRQDADKGAKDGLGLKGECGRPPEEADDLVGKGAGAREEGVELDGELGKEDDGVVDGAGSREGGALLEQGLAVRECERYLLFPLLSREGRRGRGREQSAEVEDEHLLALDGPEGGGPGRAAGVKGAEDGEGLCACAGGLAGGEDGGAEEGGGEEAAGLAAGVEGRRGEGVEERDGGEVGLERERGAGRRRELVAEALETACAQPVDDGRVALDDACSGVRGPVHGVVAPQRRVVCAGGMEVVCEDELGGLALGGRQVPAGEQRLELAGAVARLVGRDGGPPRLALAPRALVLGVVAVEVGGAEERGGAGGGGGVVCGAAAAEMGAGHVDEGGGGGGLALGGGGRGRARVGAGARGRKEGAGVRGAARAGEVEEGDVPQAVDEGGVCGRERGRGGGGGRTVLGVLAPLADELGPREGRRTGRGGGRGVGPCAGGEGVGECLVVVRPLLRCHRGVEKIGD